MQLRQMDQNGGGNVGTSPTCLMKAEHLQSSRDREEQDGRGEKDANVKVYQAYGL